jgi:hypothetical protein
MRRAPLCTLFLWLAAACTSSSRPVEMPDASPRGEVLLTAEVFSKEFPLGAVPEAPSALEVVLLRITNPSGEAFSVRLSLISPGPEGATRAVDLGGFTPYPSGQTGSYLVTISEPAREILKSATSDTRLRVSLEPVAPERPLPRPLEVAVSQPVWRAR